MLGVVQVVFILPVVSIDEAETDCCMRMLPSVFGMVGDVDPSKGYVFSVWQLNDMVSCRGLYC